MWTPTRCASSCRGCRMVRYLSTTRHLTTCRICWENSHDAEHVATAGTPNPVEAGRAGSCQSDTVSVVDRTASAIGHAAAGAETDLVCRSALAGDHCRIRWFYRYGAGPAGLHHSGGLRLGAGGWADGGLESGA